jgi:hypothetical protein
MNIPGNMINISLGFAYKTYIPQDIPYGRAVIGYILFLYGNLILETIPQGSKHFFNTEKKGTGFTEDQLDKEQ